MALITCPECGKENVSDSATSCPQCGYNIQAHFNKIKISEDQKQREIEKQEARDNNKLLQAGKKHKKLLTVLASIVIIILLIFAVFRIATSNPFKAIGPDTTLLKLYLSYGIPTETPNSSNTMYTTWNKSLYGKKGVLKIFVGVDLDSKARNVSWECEMDREEADALGEKLKNKFKNTNLDDRTIGFGYSISESTFYIDMDFK